LKKSRRDLPLSSFICSSCLNNQRIATLHLDRDPHK